MLRFAVMFMLIGWPLTATAQVFVWTGAFSSQWDNENNWSPSMKVPMSGAHVIIPETAVPPVLTMSGTPDSPLSLASLEIRSGGSLIVGGFDEPTSIMLSGAGRRVGSKLLPPLVIHRGASLRIQHNGYVKLRGNKKSPDLPDVILDGAIVFDGESIADKQPGSLLIEGHVDIRHSSAQSDTGGKIIGTVDGIITGGSQGPTVTAEDVLVLGRGHEIAGKVEVRVNFVNNGLVHADRAGTLLLCCCPKTGNGEWKVSHEDAIMKVQATLTGGNGSVVTVSDGLLDVDNYFVSCGKMQHTGGKIDVASGVLFDLGHCPAGNDCELPSN